jgi:hypothetical protein
VGKAGANAQGERGYERSSGALALRQFRERWYVWRQSLGIDQHLISIR